MESILNKKLIGLDNMRKRSSFLCIIGIVASTYNISTASALDHQSLQNKPQVVSGNTKTPQNFGKSSGVYTKIEAGFAMPVTFNHPSRDFGANGLQDIYRDNQLGNSAIVGIGIGYQVNHYLRFDVTGNYLPNARLERSNMMFIEEGLIAVEQVKQRVSSIFGLGNVYLSPKLSNDRFLPFISLGLGYASNKTGNVTVLPSQGTRNQNPEVPSGLLIANSGKTHNSLAYSVGVGLGFRLNNNLILECSYKYIDLGKIHQNLNESLTDSAAWGKKGTIESAGNLRLNTLNVGLRLMF